jgi:hypothetical protein
MFAPKLAGAIGAVRGKVPFPLSREILMSSRIGLSVLFVVVFVFGIVPTSRMRACCPAPPSGKPVVNADQTVIIIWDAANRTQHFIRKAAFQSEADDFGFIVPSPSEPELEESGSEAFPYLLKLTEPAVIRRPRPINIGCSATRSLGLPGGWDHQGVKTLQEKEVAGFNAVVLEPSPPKR